MKCRGRDLNPSHPRLAILQSRTLCSKVDPTCCQLKADVDAGPHLLSSGPSANARRWIPQGASSRPERSRLDLMRGRRRGRWRRPSPLSPDARMCGQSTPFSLSHGLRDGCAIRWSSSTTPATPTRGVSDGPCSPSINKLPCRERTRSAQDRPNAARLIHQVVAHRSLPHCAAIPLQRGRQRVGR